MASSSRLLLSAAALLAVAAASAPPYCVVGQGIPQRPNCSWYVRSRTCGTELTPYLKELAPMLKEQCCGELKAVAPECRCKALREMVMTEMSPSPGTIEQQKCWQAQAVFAATVVTEPECGLRTIHGRYV
ncbi:hypothetical protein EJB05_13427, partial [Eragrostis curvula]